MYPDRGYIRESTVDTQLLILPFQLLHQLILLYKTSEVCMFTHSLLVSPFVLDHMTVFHAELMKHMALMTHHDHRTLSIENGSYSREDFIHVCT